MRQILIFLAVTALGFGFGGMLVAMTALAQASSPNLQNEDAAGPVALAPTAHDYPIIHFPHDPVNSGGVADCYGYNVAWSSPDGVLTG